jgi:glucose dehydrogenase
MPSAAGTVATTLRMSALKATSPLSIRKSIHLRYPNRSGTLSTAGGLVFLALLDGTVAAFDDTTLEEMWKINVALASRRRR